MKDEKYEIGRNTPKPENGSARPMRPNGANPSGRDIKPVRRARHTPEEIAARERRSAPTGTAPRMGGRVPPQGVKNKPQGLSANTGRMPRTGTAKLSRARSVPDKPVKAPVTAPVNKKNRGRGRSNLTSAIWAIAIALVVGAAILSVLIARAKNIENTVKKLIEENEFTEAYRTADDSSSEGLRNLVCDAATGYYLAAGEYKNAYVYAYMYGQSAKVTDAAIDEVVRAGKDGVYSEAFSVAALSEDAGKFNSALRTVIREFTSTRDYFTALDVARYAHGEDEKGKIESSVFAEGLSYYTETMLDDDGDVFKFITAYCSPDGEGDVDENSVGEVIDRFIKEGKKAEAFIIASHFDVDTSDVEVGPADSSVRRIIGTVFPLLTADQKRAFHAQSVGYYKETFVITDGAVSGTDIKDAVSVDTHELTSVVMHKDGHVTSIGINGGEPEVTIPPDACGVQVVCGLRHAVILKDDGTCEAFGSNDFGQCDVSGWSDIVEIAAGRYFTIGLKKDGTCVGCGSNRSGQLAIAGFRNVIAVNRMLGENSRVIGIIREKRHHIDLLGRNLVEKRIAFAEHEPRARFQTIGLR